MSEDVRTIWYYSKRYNEQAACEHCEGIIQHKQWCITLTPGVYYAREIVADPSKLTIGDGLILHSLGVIWGEKCWQVMPSASSDTRKQSGKNEPQ
jgi:hypothetical protein